MSEFADIKGRYLVYSYDNDPDSESGTTASKPLAEFDDLDEAWSCVRESPHDYNDILDTKMGKWVDTEADA